MNWDTTKIFHLFNRFLSLVSKHWAIVKKLFGKVLQLVGCSGVGIFDKKSIEIWKNEFFSFFYGIG